jgi:hypothetical protein
VTEKLKQMAERIMESGPSRVLINASGEATTSRRAREEHHIHPVIVFIRDDGWSLAAPQELIDVAEKLWSDHWIGVIVRPSTEAILYDEWKESQHHDR